MQEKESIMVVQCELKILSLGITVWHHSASLEMTNSYPNDGIFNLHLTTIKESYIIGLLRKMQTCRILALNLPSLLKKNLLKVENP